MAKVIRSMYVKLREAVAQTGKFARLVQSIIAGSCASQTSAGSLHSFSEGSDANWTETAESYARQANRSHRSKILSLKRGAIMIHRRPWRVALLAPLFCFSIVYLPADSSGALSRHPQEVLAPGARLEKEIGGDEKHSYSLPL